MLRGRQSRGREAMELIEEAVHLLRRAPGSVLARYFLGTLPFVIGLLYFWADMSRSAFAGNHIEATSLGLALLFVWMKGWQASYCRRLTAYLRNEPPPRFKWRPAVRTIAGQTIWHAIGLVVLPVALVFAFPFGWTYAFFQNLTVIGYDRPRGARDAAGRAWDLAKLWPMSNHTVIAVFTLFGFFVFLNIGLAILIVPQLLKSLLGFESILTRVAWYTILNTTFLAAVASLTYVCLDPLAKAVYTLRCFYGAALTTGEDIRVELAGLQNHRTNILAALPILLLFGFLVFPAAPAYAEVENGPTLEQVDSEKLARSIERVLRQREYAWRMPRESEAEPEPEDTGMLAGVFEWIEEKFKSVTRTVKKWFNDFDRWLKRWMPQPEPRAPGGPIEWLDAVNLVLFVILAVLLCLAAVIFYRAWRKRRRKDDEIQADAVTPAAPDLNDESVGAEDLPGAQWLAMAQRLIEEGNLRLALRALYLATLARLAEYEMIGIARYKTNSDYLRELARRTADSRDIPETFAENVGMFDRAWYGRHEVDEPQVRRFAANQEKIITGVSREYGGKPRSPETPPPPGRRKDG